MVKRFMSVGRATILHEGIHQNGLPSIATTFEATVFVDGGGRYSFYRRDMGRCFITPDHSDPRWQYRYRYDSDERIRIRARISKLRGA